MKKIFSLGLAVLITSSLFCIPVQAETETETKTVYTTAEYGLNIRKTPSTFLEPADVVPYGSLGY